MRNDESRPSTRSIFFIISIASGLWIFFCAIGLIASEHFQWTQQSGLSISTQAIHFANLEDPTIRDLARMVPFLPVVLSIPFALMGVPSPSIWVSSLAGALLYSWIFLRLGSLVGRQLVFRASLILALAQPVLLGSIVTGSSDALLFALMIPALYFLFRFILEHDALERRRNNNLLPAWVEDHLFLNARIKYLWIFAFLFAAASLVEPSLFGISPLVACSTPFMIGRRAWRNFPRALSLGIVLLLPVLATHLSWSYLFWIGNPENDHSLFLSIVSFGENSPNPKDQDFYSHSLILVLLFLSFLPLAAILVRLRNLAIALLVSAVVLAEILQAILPRSGVRDLEGILIYSIFIPLSLLLLIANLKIIPKPELGLITVLLLVAEVASGIASFYL